jgi:hypothetical protein
MMDISSPWNVSSLAPFAPAYRAAAVLLELPECLGSWRALHSSSWFATYEDTILLSFVLFSEEHCIGTLITFLEYCIVHSVTSLLEVPA